MPEIKCPKCGEVFTVDESGYAAIISQVRNAEFHKELHEREAQLAKEKENELSLIKTQAKMEQEQSTAALKQEIERLKAEITTVAKDKDIEKERSLNSLNQEIERLKAQVQSNEQAKTLAVASAVSEKKDELVEKDKKIMQLESRLKEAEKDKQLQEQSLKDNFAVQLKAKDTEIAFYKDLKTRQSTKMVGETLEQHCEIEFNRLRATAFQNAYFEKDNEGDKNNSSRRNKNRQLYKQGRPESIYNGRCNKRNGICRKQSSRKRPERAAGSRRPISGGQ